MRSLQRRPAPTGWPAMRQRWSSLLFLHWRFAPAAVRPLVPAGLDLDVFDGAAWVGMTLFSVSRMRVLFLPPLPGLSEANEVNLRTYVRSGRVPGVWFFSLDITKALAAWGGRLGWHLPYFNAQMQIERDGDDVSCTGSRTDHRGAPASFDAHWRTGALLGETELGSLEYFLVERYILFSGSDHALWQAQIHHRPWALREAEIGHVDTSLLASSGLPPPDEEPLAHAQASSFDVAAWWPKRVQ